MELIAAIVIVGVAVAGAFLFMQRSDAARDAREESRRREEAARLASETGLPAGSRPLWGPTESDPLVRKMLDDGDAYNSPHAVADPAFLRTYWVAMDAGGGMALALVTAMRDACWKRDSRKQVFDRLYSHGKISASQAGRLKSDADRRLPEGYGKGDCSTMGGADPGPGILAS